MSLRLRIGIVYHLYCAVGMRWTLRDKFPRHNFAKVGQAVLADIVQH